MTLMDFEAWRCGKDEQLMCPDEGCPRGFCARDNGWLPGHPSPPECTGENPARETPESAGSCCVMTARDLLPLRIAQAVLFAAQSVVAAVWVLA